MSIPGEFSKLSFADNVSVVLNQPQQNLNIGMVARAMMNLGFKNLILVKPHNFDAQKAAITARWATPMVEQAPQYETLKEALEEFQDVVGFGGRYDDNKIENISLPQWIEGFQTPHKHKIALVFGSEDRGLNTDEINHCRFLIRIPSTEEYPSYNLAQSVLLALYQVSSLGWKGTLPPQEERILPTRNEFYQLERMLDSVLTNTGFYRNGTPEPIRGVIKRLFQRTNPDEREMGILLAMIGRIDRALIKYTNEGKQLPEEEDFSS